MGDAQNSDKQRGKPFAKGDQRINRGGRPKGYNAFRKSFRGIKDHEVIQARLREIMAGGEAKDAISAAKLWLEYGWGKSPAAPEDNKALAASGNGAPDWVSRLTPAQALAIARGEKPE